ncbi:hypothetical protein [Comamonas testosteroni]|uniref:hypothetical protein n=1 Tax=Comamonas testosteroni TaxID=285 RepID=UPI00391D9028
MTTKPAHAAPLATMAASTPISEPIQKAKMNNLIDKPATPEERLDAIEDMLGHLILLLEAEPNFTAENLVKWIARCRLEERDRGISNPRAQVVFGQLCEKLDLVDTGPSEATDPAAQQAAQSALEKIQRKPPAD